MAASIHYICNAFSGIVPCPALSAIHEIIAEITAPKHNWPLPNNIESNYPKDPLRSVRFRRPAVSFSGRAKTIVLIQSQTARADRESCKVDHLVLEHSFRETHGGQSPLPKLVCWRKFLLNHRKHMSLETVSQDSKGGDVRLSR